VGEIKEQIESLARIVIPFLIAAIPNTFFPSCFTCGKSLPWKTFWPAAIFPHFLTIFPPSSHPRVRCQSVVYFSGGNFSFVAIIGIATHEGVRQ